MRIQVLGLCRFSMLVQGDFQATGEDLDRNRALLYDPARMEQRMRWFENLCLPPLMWQHDPDFTLILATGEDLPEPWIGRLRAIAEAVPQIRLEQVAPGRHAEICKALLARHTEPDADVVAQFRMDDDDAVARDYVARVRRDWRMVAPMMNGNDPVALDYGRGLVLEQARDGGLSLRCELTHFWVPALTLYFPGGKPRSIMNYRHDWMWRFVPTISRPDGLMWVRGFHASNDSPRDPYGHRKIEMSETEIEAALLRRFGLGKTQLFGAISGQDAGR